MNKATCLLVIIEMQNIKSLIDDFVNNEDSKNLLLNNVLTNHDRKEIYQYIDNINIEKNINLTHISQRNHENNKIIKLFKENEDITINKIIELFTRYYNVPIAVSRVEYIDYYLSILDEYYPNFKNNYKNFMSNCKMIDNKMIYSHINNSIKNYIDAILSFVRNHEEFKNFMTNVVRTKIHDKLDKMDIMSSKNFYKNINVNKKFISVDIIKANYTIMHEQCPKIFSSSYDNFLKGFIKDPERDIYVYNILKESKIARERLFGELGVTKTILKLCEKTIYEQILKDNKYLLDEMVYFHGDEIIFNYTKTISDVLNTIIKNNKKYKVTNFILKDIAPEYGFYIK